MKETSLHEIHVRAIEALSAALDPIEMARFFQQFSSGAGDYTKERGASLAAFSGVDSIVRELEKRRTEKQGA